MLAQGIADAAKGLVDVGVVGLAADDEQHVGAREEVPVADRRHRLHLLVGRIAAEIRGDDRRVAQHLGHQRVGATAERRGEDRARLVDHEDVRLALVGAQLVDLLLESRDVRGEDLVGQPEPADSRIVTVEAALEVAGHRGQPAVAGRLHADRIQLQRGHAVVVQQLPELRQLLHQGRDDLLGRANVGQRVGDDEGLEPGQRLERHRGDLRRAQLLDVDAAAMGEGHGGRAVAGVVGDREVDLVVGRHAGLEGDAVGLGAGVAVAVFGEVQALLLGKRGLEIAGPADQIGLALLADAAAEQRLDEDQAVAADQVLDLVLARVRPQHLRGRESDMAEQPRSVEHAGQLHRKAPSRPAPAGRLRDAANLQSQPVA